MKPSQDKELVGILISTAEIYGRSVSPQTASILIADLDNFDSEQIKLALSRCRKELPRFPSVAEIIARIDDGRPGPEEAWALVPKREEESGFWTQEMQTAFGIARPLLLDGDLVAARMAFKESYTSLVTEARTKNIPVYWEITFGHELNGRIAAVVNAVAKNRITREHAQKILPDYESKAGFSVEPGIAAIAGLKQIPNDTW